MTTTDIYRTLILLTFALLFLSETKVYYIPHETSLKASR